MALPGPGASINHDIIVSSPHSLAGTTNGTYCYINSSAVLLSETDIILLCESSSDLVTCKTNSVAKEAFYLLAVVYDF